mgnify:CR=1 FL=1
MKHTKNKAAEKPLQDYPGAAVDSADRDKTNPRLVKQETRILNNNPRDTDNKMP